MNDDTMIQLDGILRQRGLFAVAHKHHWQPAELVIKGQRMRGWHYPLFRSDGRQFDGVARFKRADVENNPDLGKYMWVGNLDLDKRECYPRSLRDLDDRDKPRYYILPGGRDAIQQAGAVTLAAGEPDVLALASAGVTNTLCWLFGEGGVPGTLRHDLGAVGATSAIYLADNDYAGGTAAAKVRATLGDFPLRILEWPGSLGAGADANAAWIHVGQDRGQFLALVQGLRDRDLGPYERQNGQNGSNGNGQRSLDPNAWADLKTRVDLRDYARRVLGAPKIAGADYDQYSAPDREDKNPSLTVWSDGFKDFGANVAGSCIDFAMRYGGNGSGLSFFDAVQEFGGVDGFKRPASVPTNPTPTGAGDSESVPELVPAGMFTPLDDVMQQAFDLLDGKKRELYPPVVMPYRAIQHCGGYTVMMKRGHGLMATLGISGGFKTAFTQQQNLGFMREGYTIYTYSPEWSPTDLLMRLVQHLNGPTLNYYLGLLLWYMDRDAGVPEEARRGMAPKPGIIANAKRILEQKVAALPGTEVYVEIPPEERKTMTLDRFFGFVGQQIAADRAAGLNPAVLTFDYADFAKGMIGRSGNQNWAEYFTDEFADFCKVNHMVGHVLIQPKKAVEDEIKSGQRPLRMSDASWIPNRPFKLFLCLTPGYTGGKLNSHMWVEVAKNSLGPAGWAKVNLDAARFALGETAISTDPPPAFNNYALK